MVASCDVSIFNQILLQQSWLICSFIRIDRMRYLCDSFKFLNFLIETINEITVSFKKSVIQNSSKKLIVCHILFYYKPEKKNPTTNKNTCLFVMNTVKNCQGEPLVWNMALLLLDHSQFSCMWAWITDMGSPHKPTW